MPVVINRHGKTIAVNNFIASNDVLLKKNGYRLIDETPTANAGVYKTGVGITTCNRPAILKRTLEYIKRYTPGARIFVNDDTTRHEGVAKAKNNCLAALDDCDYIFLFDDDCYPVKNNWAELFIEASVKTGNHHFSLTFDKLHNGRGNGNDLVSDTSGLEQYRNPCGMMLFFTRQCIEQVGGFDCNYDTYGYEHVGLSHRIYNAGLTRAPFLSVKNAMDYFYCYDYYSTPANGAAINKRALIKKNETLFNTEKRESYYKPYKTGSCVMSVYLCSRPDPQRGVHFKPEFKPIASWAQSVKKRNMQAVLFHDCFSTAQVRQWSGRHLKFVCVHVPAEASPYYYRFTLYERYLEKFGQYIENVFLTDCTDVEVLQNPFLHPVFSKNKIYVGDEPSVVASDWMKSEAGELSKAWTDYAAFEKTYAQSTLLNAGILGGSTNAVLPFIKDMAMLAKQYQHLAKTDMPLFNFVARQPKYKELIVHGAQVNTVFKKYERDNEVAWFRHK